MKNIQKLMHQFTKLQVAGKGIPILIACIYIQISRVYIHTYML